MSNIREEIQKGFKESQRMITHLIDNLPGVVYRCKNDKNWTMEYMSDYSIKLTGYSPEDFIGDNKISFADLMHSDDRQRVWNEIQLALNKKKKFKLVYRIITADSKIKCVQEHGNGIYSSEGKLIALEGFIIDVSETLKSEVYYKTIFNNTGTALMIVDEDTTILQVNHEFEVLLGYSKDELENKMSWTSLISTEEHLKKMLKYHQLRRTTHDVTTRNYESQFIDKHKNVVDVYMTGALIPGTKKSVLSLLDITDKKQSRNALQESEARYRTIVETTHEGIVIFDEKNRISYVNKQMAVILGYETKEMLGMHVFNFLKEDHKQKIEKELFKRRKGVKRSFEIPLYKKDGSYIWALISGTALYDFNDQFLGILGMIRDITERKKSEEALRLSNIYNRSLIEVSLDPLVTIGPDGKIMDVNSSTEIVTGYSRSELIGTDFSDYFTQSEKARKGYKEVFQKGLVKDYPLEIQNRNGNITPVLYNASIYKDESGSVIGVFAAARDVTELKIVERALRESEGKYRNLAELLPQPVFESNLNGNITFTNRIGRELFGYTREDIEKGLNMFQVLVPEDRDRAMENSNRRINGEKLGVREYNALKKDGTVFPILIYVDAIIHKNEIVGSRGVVVDITERKKAEEDIKTSLNEKEILLKEIHHRVKNNMQIISSLLNLQSKYLTDVDAVNAFNESQGRIMSMSLVHETLYLSNNLSSINFRDYVNRMVIGLISSYNASMISVKLNIRDIMLNIETAIPCGLIINELVTNSIKHAFPQQSTGLISVEFIRESDKLKLMVSDNGVGLPMDLFYGESNSLGLQLVKMLVNQLDGELKINSNQGTTFIITFEELEYKKRV